MVFCGIFTESIWAGRIGSGPGCIKQLKIKWKFLQPFPKLQRIFFQATMNKSTEGRLKSTGSTMTVRKRDRPLGSCLKGKIVFAR